MNNPSWPSVYNVLVTSMVNDIQIYVYILVGPHPIDISSTLWRKPANNPPTLNQHYTTPHEAHQMASVQPMESNQYTMEFASTCLHSHNYVKECQQFATYVI